MPTNNCDMCGSEVPHYALISLLNSYKTKNIENLCSKCADATNDHLSKLRLLNHNWYSRVLKIWMRNKRRMFTNASK